MTGEQVQRRELLWMRAKLALPLSKAERVELIELERLRSAEQAERESRRTRSASGEFFTRP